ncbi:MAG: LysR family transcriptional regulator [Lachnospiraceae bacterium]|nr:LysR family transcriptional regulator [Ruminococcus sp.]MCM1276630.1 LysR family transcriptional regulator [Lachnospiraceae bacterium]
MEIRVLRYFLEVAREKSITRAAVRLHISQPTLSKQLKDLEDELGQKLFVRNNYGITLTDAGMLLRKRAEDILEMTDKTLNEFKSLTDETGGDIHIGCAESEGIKYLARCVEAVREKNPLIRCHLHSGNTEDIEGRLESGLFDFAFLVEPPDLAKYNYLEVPYSDVWGVVMRSDDPLAEKESICVDDLLGYNIICSSQAVKTDLPRWCGEKSDTLNISFTVNLVYNGAVFVREGLGVMFSFDKLANTDGELCFRPLSPKLETKMCVVWKKYQMFSPAAETLLEEMRARFS